MAINSKINILLKTLEELNGVVAKQSLDLFHYYNEVLNGFQGLFLEILKNYKYAGSAKKSIHPQKMSRDASEHLQTLGEIIKTELPKEEKAMKKVTAFKKPKTGGMEDTRGSMDSPGKPDGDGSSPARDSQMAAKPGSNKAEPDTAPRQVPAKPQSQPKEPPQSQPRNAPPEAPFQSEIQRWSGESPNNKGTSSRSEQGMAEDEMRVRDSISKAIHQPRMQDGPIEINGDDDVPSYRIDPRTDRAVEINGDDGKPIMTSNKFDQRVKAPEPVEPKLVIPNFKLMSLKAMTEFVDDFLIRKRLFDEQGGDTTATRSFAEDFLFAYLKKKYGLAELIMQNSLVVVESAKHWSATDHKVALFNHVNSLAATERNRRGLRGHPAEARGQPGRNDQGNCHGLHDQGQGKEAPGGPLPAAPFQVEAGVLPRGCHDGSGLQQGLRNLRRP